MTLTATGPPIIRASAPVVLTSAICRCTAADRRPDMGLCRRVIVVGRFDGLGTALWRRLRQWQRSFNARWWGKLSRKFQGN